MNTETLALIRVAVQELAEVPPYPNPWHQVRNQIDPFDDEFLAWWWRSINKIDIPTWHTLRAKVVELRLRA